MLGRVGGVQVCPVQELCRRAFGKRHLGRGGAAKCGGAGFTNFTWNLRYGIIMWPGIVLMGWGTADC